MLLLSVMYVQLSSLNRLRHVFLRLYHISVNHVLYENVLRLFCHHFHWQVNQKFSLSLLISHLRNLYMKLSSIYR